jgi:hypothetical protein
VSDAGSGSGILRLPPENSAAFCREFKNSLFQFTYLKAGAYTDTQRLFKSFPARNLGTASYNA